MLPLKNKHNQRYMKLFRTLLLAAAATLLSSCATQKQTFSYMPKFPSSRTAAFEPVGDPIRQISSRIKRLDTYGPYFVVISAAQRGENSLHLYDRDSGHLVLEAIPWGDGAGEVESNFTYSLDSGSGLLEYSDFRTGKILSVQLDSLADMGTAAIRERPYGKTEPDLTIAPTRFGRLVSVEDFSEDGIPAIILVDRKGRERARTEGYNFLPEDSEKGRSNFTGSCKVSPDGRRFAIVYRLGGIMEIYSIRPHKLKLKHIYSFIESPDSLYSTGSYSYHKDDIFGFGDVYAGESRIYAVFDGETNRLIYMEESMLGDPQQYPAYSNIAVFDWKGTPLELIRTGTRIENIHVDERDHRLYALYYDDNGDLRIGTLNLEP